MAPKAGVEDAMADMAKQLKVLTATIQSNNTRMDSLEMLIKGLTDENKSLKKELVDRDKEISGLKTLVNNMDQRHRSWSARIFNIKMAKEDEYDNYKVMDAVYRTALLPILQGALADKVICKIPTVEQLLETAQCACPSGPGRQAKASYCPLLQPQRQGDRLPGQEGLRAAPGSRQTSHPQQPVKTGQVRLPDLRGPVPSHIRQDEGVGHQRQDHRLLDDQRLHPLQAA